MNVFKTVIIGMLAITGMSPSYAQTFQLSEPQLSAQASTTSHSTNESTLLIEESSNGSPGRVAIVPGSPQNLRNSPFLRLIYGANASLRLPFITVNGRLGLSTRDGIVDLGVEGGLGTGAFSNDRSGMIAIIGGHLMLSPIPGEVGRRIYLFGKVFRAFTLTQSGDADDFRLGGFNFWEAGLGYRHAGANSLLNGGRYWFIEAGITRAFGEVCNVSHADCLETPDGTFVPNVTIGLTGGLTWR